MSNKPHITYEQLKKIVSWGIFNRPIKGNGCDTSDIDHLKIEGAVYGGIYVGSPGKDIYLMLPYMSDERMKKIVVILSDNFNKKIPISYGNVAACIRFIYGQFEKQGILKSDKDFDRMKKEKIDWTLSRKFLNFLKKELEIRHNYYGLSMIYEMEGHRLGDEAVINNDNKKLNKMERIYNKSVDFAYKCKNYKHRFSVFYWAGEYFSKFGDVENAIKYFKFAVINAGKYYHKYFPNGEQYYSVRLKKSLKYIKKNNKEAWKDINNIYINKIRSSYLRSKLK